jgi:hypothetical protein
MGPRHDNREPPQEPTREPLVDLTVKPWQPGELSTGANPRRRRLSDTESNGNKASPQEEPAREKLAAPEVRPPQPGEPSTGLRLRRKRSADTAPQDNETPPPPQSGQLRRRSLAPSEAGSHEPASEPGSSPEPRRPRLVNLAATAAVALEETGPEGATAEEQEPRPKMGRARVTITQAPEDPAGLQSIIDPPRSLKDVLAPVQSEVVPAVTDQPAKPGLSVALVGGVTAALAAALVWALITMATGWHAGWMAIGVGLLIGVAVRTMGRGEEKSFGYLGAAVSVLGCLVGDLLSACALVAGQESLSPLTVMTYICSKPEMIPEAMIATFQFLDLLFWAIGAYAAYRLSFRHLPPVETGSAGQSK